MNKKRGWGLLALVATVLIVCELIARAAFYLSPTLERRRRVFTDVVDFSRTFQNSIGQSYLNYIPNPEFESDGKHPHNAQGYRGRAVAVRRTAGVSRVLFLGGSTTYGWSVPNSEETFPAQIEKILSASGNRVEVINAGVPWATSAEFLTHYLFKFRYYRPDLVVIMPSGNDAAGRVRPHYHPDYSNWRIPLASRPEFSLFGRTILTSRLFSLPILMLFRHSGASFVKDDGGPPAAPWYPEVTPVPETDYAFRRNLETLLREISSDGPKILLVNFRWNPQTRHDEQVDRWLRYDERVFKETGEKFGLPVVDNPASTISAKNWVDNCHLNADGESERARYLSPLIRKALAVR